MQLRQPAADRIWPYTIAILLLPILVLWRHDDPLYTPLWQSDPWFYFGYFRNLVNFKRDLFPNYYYGSRLSWILPGYLVHSTFPPLIANAVLHLTVHSVAALSLFTTLRLTIGIRSAYLTAMIFSLHPWIWCATGWDHVNGAGIAYGLLAMALLTRAALQPVRKGSLILAGMALAGAVYAHLFLVAFVPLLLLYYVGLTSPCDYRQALHSSSILGLWTGVGFAAVTAPLCLVNYRLDGNPWFWSPSFKTAQAATQNYIWTESIWSDQRLVPWLWFIVAGVAVAVLLLPGRLRNKKTGRNLAGLLFSGQLLLAATLMGFLQIRGITLLGHYYYACYLLPFVFLAFGSSLWPAVEQMRLRTYLITSVIATLLFGALWYDPPAASRLFPQWLALLSGGVTLAIALLLRGRRVGAFLAIASLAVITLAVYTGSYRLVDLHGTRAEYTRLINARTSVEARRNGAPIQFWYDKHEPLFFEYFALNATYLAEFSRVSDTFPAGCVTSVDPATLIVVTSQKEQAAELARSALADCWQPFGTHPRVESAAMIPNPRGPYRMIILRVEAGASPKSAGDLFRSIALEQIQRGDPKVSFERWPEGLEMTTLPAFGAFAARIPLGLNSHHESGFSVLVRARVLDGKVGFGVLDSSSKTYLVLRPMWALPSMSDVVLPLPSPPITGDLIMSNLTTNHAASTVIIEKIEIRKAP